MAIDWPVKVHPSWQRARPVLLATVWPFFAVRAVVLWVNGGKVPIPHLAQLLLLPFALIFLGLPTRLYELAGIVTVLEEADNGIHTPAR